MKEINATFIDNYVHFGSDIISGDCYNRRPSIKEWMARNNISNYAKLHSYYREKQKAIWRGISKAKKVIYWINESSDIPDGGEDVLHWYGSSENLSKLAGRNN
jgi:hypothetical protein